MSKYVYDVSSFNDIKSADVPFTKSMKTDIKALRLLVKSSKANNTYDTDYLMTIVNKICPHTYEVIPSIIDNIVKDNEDRTVVDAMLKSMDKILDNKKTVNDATEDIKYMIHKHNTK